MPGDSGTCLEIVGHAVLVVGDVVVAVAVAIVFLGCFSDTVVMP